jgi:hypothetical protein
MARIGFYVRNAFQVSHFRTLFEATPDALWIGKNSSKLASFGIGPEEPVATSRFFLRRLMERDFDIVVSQAGPPGKGKFDHAKFVMVQYGYAKEPYNFGEWRADAHLILAYGPYAQSRFSERAPSISIGNPRWDDWNDAVFRQTAVDTLSRYISPDRKTVLYAPTWGDLSSAPDWLDTVKALAQDYNVLVKAHHNSTRDGHIAETSKHPNLHFLPDNDLFALMSVSDVVISDLSGAIFDAVLCGCPVVLVAPKELGARLSKKLDAQSMEVANRAEFGTVVNIKSDLAPAIANAIQNGSTVSEDWTRSLFRTDGSVATHFQEALDTLQIVA